MNRKFGRMVALKGAEITSVKIEEAIQKQKLVTAENQSVHAALQVGVSFGVEEMDHTVIRWLGAY
jgi:hypothetical protein